MPIYEYKALNSKGKIVSGSVDADSVKSARIKLRQSGIYIKEIKEETKGKSLISGLPIFSSYLNRIRSEDISIMTRQLSTLIGAGLPVVDALTALTEQTENPHLKKIISSVRENVNEGASFADSLNNYPGNFSTIYINMIRAGESSGALNIVLAKLAEFMERQLALKNKIKAALTYPIIMAIIGVIILSILLTYVVPKITQVFAQSKASLPLPTVILMFMSDLLKHWWWAVMIALVFMIGSFKKYAVTTNGKYFVDRMTLKIPIFGEVFKKSAISRFTRTLSVLITSGIPILKSLDIVSAIVDNCIISDAINIARDNIKEGEDIASPLRISGLFPPMVIHMIAIGEKSGNLEAMLTKVADVYDNEVESTIQSATSLLEPMMIVIMGGIICFIVVAILLPIFEMNQLIN